MKKRINYLLMCLLFLLTFADNVYADNISISTVLNSSQIVKGEKAVITVKLTADEVVSQCKFKFVSDDGIVYDKASSVNGWNLSGTGVEGILVVGPLDSTEKPNEFSVLQVEYIVNNSGKITVKTEQCVTAVDDKALYPAEKTIDLTVIEKNDDTTLSSLSVTNSKSFDFDPNNTVDVNGSGYAVSLEGPEFSLLMTASNPDYQDKIVVKGEDNKVYDPSNITFSGDSNGNNLMLLYIYVNDKHMYTLCLSYIQKDLDNSLSSVKINDFELNLVDGKLDYEVEIDSDVTSVSIVPTLKDSVNFKIGDASNIKNGMFTISSNKEFETAVIVVEPVDSKIGAESITYTITLKRKGVVEKPKEEDPKPSAPIKPDDIDKNPDTGDISMFVMSLILIASLVGSVILYRKNLESYK